MKVRLVTYLNFPTLFIASQRVPHSSRLPPFQAPPPLCSNSPLPSSYSADKPNSPTPSPRPVPAGRSLFRAAVTIRRRADFARRFLQPCSSALASLLVVCRRRRPGRGLRQRHQCEPPLLDFCFFGSFPLSSTTPASLLVRCSRSPIPLDLLSPPAQHASLNNRPTSSASKAPISPRQAFSR
jgi:hypothetical protein